MPNKQILLIKNNLLENFKYLSSLNKDISITPVLKSNAYGHGIIEIAKILDNLNCPFFCVNSFDEALILWKNNIHTKLLVMGHVDPEDLKKDNFPFSYTIYNYSQLTAINKYQKGAEIHIFVDTGMHREGFRIEKLPSLLSELKKLNNIKVVGVMSHLASGDKPKNIKTQNQLEKFSAALKIIYDFGFDIKYQHIAASAGFLSLNNTNYNIGNIARIGKALYGIDPRGKNPNLKPILKFTTKLVQVKLLEKNSSIGYDGTFTTHKKTVVGVLPIGYYDGLDRRLSNKGELLVNNVPCPILGRVSMNITSIDVSRVKNPKVGDEVIVISENSNDPNSVENFAKIAKTIPYDISVKINPIIQRVIFEG